MKRRTRLALKVSACVTQVVFVHFPHNIDLFWGGQWNTPGDMFAKVFRKQKRLNAANYGSHSSKWPLRLILWKVCSVASVAGRINYSPPAPLISGIDSAAIRDDAPFITGNGLVLASDLTATASIARCPVLFGICAPLFHLHTTTLLRLLQPGLLASSVAPPLGIVMERD